MIKKTKPLVVIINTGEVYGEKLGDELESAGFKIQTFDKESLALKFLERNSVQGVLYIGSTLEKAKALINDVCASVNPVALFCSMNQCSPENIAELLNLGCDDLFLKSSPSIEIIARIRAVLRRSSLAKNRQLAANINLDTDKFNFHGATINPGQLEIIFNDKNKCSIGKKELGIIYSLANNPGVIVSRNNLIHAVWGTHADTRSRSVDQYITKIRVLFEKHADGLNHLRTLHGIGYWYDPKLLVKK